MTQVNSEKTVWGGWGASAVLSPPPCHLEDVMSEELAKQLHESENVSDFQKALEESVLSSLSGNLNLETTKSEDKENQKKKDQITVGTQGSSGDGNGIPICSDQLANPGGLLEHSLSNVSDGGETSNDLLIAQMMQHDMILEHNRELRKVQEFKNGNSKVKLSNENMFYFEKDEEDEEEYEEDDFSNKSNSKEGDRRGCKGIVTKHNPIVAGRRNVSRMENLPPGLATGNSMAFDMKLPNAVYNKIKVASKQESKRAHRLHEKKEQATKTVAIDDMTKVTLMKLLGSGVVAEVGGVVSGGKEAAVFYAVGGASATMSVPSEAAIKVFKKHSPFKTKGEYMRGDIRFRRGHANKLLKEWVEKEEQNLKRMTKFGIPCPQPITKKNNILVMSFIGRNQVAAPKLTDALLSEEEFQSAYKQSIKILIDMYRKCSLVHSDLSQYNLLWFEGVVYVIDVAQAVLSSHPKALEYLMRDCINITEFFQPVCTTPWQQLFGEVTGLHIEADKHEFVAQLQKLVKDKEDLKKNGLSDEQFEFFLEKATLERRQASDALGDKDRHDDDDDDDDDDTDEDGDDDSDGCCDGDHVACEAPEKGDEDFVVVDGDEEEKGEAGDEEEEGEDGDFVVLSKTYCA